MSAVFAGQAVAEEDATILARTCWALVHGFASLVIDGQLGAIDEASVVTQTRELTGVLGRGFGPIDRS